MNDGSRSKVWCFSMKMPSPLSQRRNEMWVSWKEMKNSEYNDLKAYRVGFCPTEDYPGLLPHEDDMTMRHQSDILAKSRGYYHLTEVAPNVTKVTLVRQDDLGGSVPDFTQTQAMKKFLSEVEEIEIKFRRNGVEVDREVQGYFAKVMARVGPQFPPLNKEELEIIERCRSMQIEAHRWKKIKSPFPRVEMCVEHLDNDVTTLGTAMGKAILDCRAEEAAAWYFDYCSNDRNRTGFERGQLARFTVEDSNPNERIFASITCFPFPLNARDAVFRQIWTKKEPNSFEVCLESLPNSFKVDFGGPVGKLLRSYSRAYVLCEHLEPIGGIVSQCALTLIQFFDAGGSLPAWVINKKLPEIFSVIHDIQVYFNRDEEVDNIERNEYAERIRSHQGTYTEKENKMEIRAMGLFQETMQGRHFKKLDVADKFISSRVVHLDNDSLVTGLAKCVVDAPLEEVAAWEMLKMSRQGVKAHILKGGIDKWTREINEHSQYYVQTRDLKIPGLSVREWRSKVVWKKLNEKQIMIMYEDTRELDEELGSKYTLGTARTVFMMERLPDLKSMPQTSVVFVVRVDIAGAVPSFIMNKQSEKFTKNLTNMRTTFDKSLAYDKIHREIFAAAIRSFAKMPMLQGADAAQGVYERLSLKEEGSEQLKISSIATAFVKVNQASGSTITWGKVTADFGVSLEEAAAFMWMFDSRAFVEFAGEQDRKVVFTKSAFKKKVIKYRQMKSKKGGLRHTKRHFANEMSFHRIDRDTIIILSEPTELDEQDKIDGGDEQTAAIQRAIARGRRMSVSDKLRSSFLGHTDISITGSETIALRLVRTSKNRTIIDMVAEMDLGELPLNIAKDTMEKALAELPSTQIYFELLKSVADMETDDGRILGHAMLWRVLGEGKFERVQRILERSAALRELTKKHSWLPLFFQELRKGKLVLNSSVSTKLACITSKEARQIGKNMIPALKSRKTAEAGILQWKHQNPAMDELTRTHPWVENLLVILARGIVKSAAWGLMWRVSVGAILSFLDLTTDIYVGYEFFAQKRYLFGGLTVGSIGLSMILQVVVVLFQNRKKFLSRIVKECIYVVSGLKAPVDAYKVAMGSEKEMDSFFDPLMEMTYSKMIELFAESIPGCVIQICGYMTNPDPDGMALASIIISALTAGFTGAQISYDMDTDPSKRATKPHFYGYVPDVAAKRTIVFITMVFMNASMLLVKSLAVALFIRLGSNYVLGYFAIDLGVFFAIKIWNRDFTYYLPLEGFWFTLVISCLIRFICKIIADFTGIVHMRHPGEMGGAYFTFNVMSSLCALLVATKVNDDRFGDMRNTWRLCGLIFLAMGVLWTVFLRTIKKEYLGTFFSTETGFRSNVRMFLDSTDESVKITIFGCHPSQWEGIREEVKTWIMLNWERWREEKPEWLTQERKTQIPDDFKPTEQSLFLQTIKTDRSAKVVPTVGGPDMTVRTKRAPRIKVDGGNRDEIIKIT